MSGEQERGSIVFYLLRVPASKNILQVGITFYILNGAIHNVLAEDYNPVGNKNSGQNT